MKRNLLKVLIGILFTCMLPAVGMANAINIHVNSDGSGIDAAALEEVRQLSGQAVANGTVDNFIVSSPRVGGPIPREGGLSACAEIGFNSTTENYDAFIGQLSAIQPKAGTTINLERTGSCLPIPSPIVSPFPGKACGGITGKTCPSGQICMDVPFDDCNPRTGGRDCSGICQVNRVMCTMDVKQCPDGSFVGRTGPNCAFAPCPPDSTK